MRVFFGPTECESEEEEVESGASPAIAVATLGGPPGSRKRTQV